MTATRKNPHLGLTSLKQTTHTSSPKSPHLTKQLPSSQKSHQPITMLLNERQSDTLCVFAYAIMKSIDGTSYALLLLGHGENSKVYLDTPTAYSQRSSNSTVFDCLSEIVARRTELRIKSVEGMAGEPFQHREELCKVGGKECTGPNLVGKMLTVIAFLVEVSLGIGVCENRLPRLPPVTAMGIRDDAKNIWFSKDMFLKKHVQMPGGGTVSFVKTE